MSKSNDSSAPIRHALMEKLRAGGWKSGDRLPPERELSKTYAVGRALVRRVLSEFKDKGYITQAVGSGTYVAPDLAARLQATEPVAPATQTSPAELMEARVLMEPVMIDLVVRHGTAADFKRMEECCAHGEAAGTLEEFEHWDGALHQAIADASHNNFVRSVFQLMNTAREQGDWGMLKKKSATPERRLVYQREHRALVAALKDRDSESARQLLTGHLLQVRRNMLGY